MNMLIADNLPFIWLPKNNKKKNYTFFDWLTGQHTSMLICTHIYILNDHWKDRSTPSVDIIIHPSYALYINICIFCFFSDSIPIRIWTLRVCVCIWVSVCVCICIYNSFGASLSICFVVSCVFHLVFHMGVGQFKICICLDWFWFLADFLFIFDYLLPPRSAPIWTPLTVLPRPVAFIAWFRHKFQMLFATQSNIGQHVAYIDRYTSPKAISCRLRQFVRLELQLLVFAFCIFYLAYWFGPKWMLNVCIWVANVDSMRGTL